jgi:hypothetical protein
MYRTQAQLSSTTNPFMVKVIYGFLVLGAIATVFALALRLMLSIGLTLSVPPSFANPPLDIIDYLCQLVLIISLLRQKALGMAWCDRS